ncbi:hypothetical protein HIO71_10240 [Chryseobacterium aquaticum]|jgi:hypothetical protein|uniref:Multidrug transporter n=1 Tax=Chryseobacterium aquaticum TaxID=452084 RepID=A0A0Q3SHD8_9FLAO|nr:MULTISPECIES: hypothetical protein [Chryseobacterium]KQK24570.1 hypothetical protein AR438_15375 [Chryseobacterium aquaticum]NMR34585.1 hypothetical protein [Chryseobacterium aquaticum]NRQ46430.1 hypothetical protein [Chryseobacterium sp. C-204]
MKTNLLTLLSLSLLLSISSCTIDINDGDGGTVTTPGTTAGILPEGGKLSGEITSNLTIKKGNYTLEGIVKVADGATLTIEAGATFTVSTNVSSSLVILQGGKILALGSASEPIVFTTTAKTAGGWGGITLYGRAPIKAVNGNATAVSEDGNAITYGGTDANFSSGIMKFVRVEYAGKKIGDGTSETNTFTFYAVGDGTILENLVAYKGTDDGFEWFGGTVSAKNLVSYGNFDDSFDWQDAWSGQNNSNWFAFQTVTGNFGMEIEASANVDNTAPKISNITLIRDTNTNPEVAGSTEISAIQFKRQGTGIFSNVYISGYKNLGGKNAYAVLIQDDATNTSQVNANPSKIVVSPLNYVNSDNPLVWGYAATNGGKTFTNTSTVTKVSLPTGAWATVDGVNLLSAL